ncbi:MAG: ferritin-like domain-containing protein [Candidatus Omnitrophota bacterium]
MNFSFSMQEIAHLAAKAEDAGHHFYHRMADTAKDPKVKQICLFFANEENEHRATFAAIARDPQAKTKRNFSADIPALMKQGIEKLKQSGFQSEDIDFSHINFKQCLELALDIELESIAIYEDVRKRMEKNYDSILYSIIREEHKHVETIENVLHRQDPRYKANKKVAKIIKPDTIVVRKRKVSSNTQDLINIIIIFLCFVGLILAMIGPKHLSYIIDALIAG